MTHVFKDLGQHIGVGFDNLSAADSSEDENRDEEIKKLLEEGLSNVTFDDDSDHSCSKSNSIVSKQSSFNSGSGKENSNHSINSNERIEGSSNYNGFNVGAKHVNGNTSIPHQRSQSVENSFYNSKLSNNINHHNSNGSTSNGIVINRSDDIFRRSNSKHPRMDQSDRENEEIEATNPTISLIHKQHCPQNENDELGSAIWLAAENSTEQLKTLCEFRERQVVRAEDTIAALSKDKRALNHQIGLMKTEIIQMKTQHDDAEKVIKLRDEEVRYLKTKIREAIEEYELVRRGEIAAKEECTGLITEIDKLRQEVKLLSSIGSSAQQAGVDQVVRQIREKHARELASYQTLVNQLEGEARTFKRAQQLMLESSFVTEKHAVQTQTDSILIATDEDIAERERRLAEQEFQEEFGAGDIIPEVSKSTLDVNRDNVINVQELQLEWDAEKNRLIQYYETEVEAYKSRLISLPNQLYTNWKKTYASLGLSPPIVQEKQEIKNAATSTDTEVTASKSKITCDMSTSYDYTTEPQRNSNLNYASISNKEKEAEEVMTKINPQDASRSERKYNTFEKEMSSVVIQTDLRETSSVVIQTDETLETYKILAGLIEQWANEVAQSTLRAEGAESQFKLTEDELNKLRKKFKYLQKMAGTCRKEWKKQEDALKKKNSEIKAHYMDILRKLNEKLEGID